MIMLSDASLRNTLEPVVIVMDAFKKASGWQVIYTAWTASKPRYRWYFIGLSTIFLALGICCVWLNNIWLFILAVTIEILGLLIFRFLIIDRYPLSHTYSKLDRHFGLRHRFRRYLIFRSYLQQEDIDLDTINRVQRLLVSEASRLEPGE